ncbi:MAG TPA: helix-turn-helix domain-containing protein [Chloroflexota bacterium]|nr:helix-turn-helix domain-containing protein [Chloroflexota bacterium]
MEKATASVADQTVDSAVIHRNGGVARAAGPCLSDAGDEIRDLREEQQNLRHALAVYEELVQLALNGAGLSRVATALARSVGNPVLIENRFFRALAYAVPTGAPAREDRPCPTGTLLKRAEAQALRPCLEGDRQPVLIPAASDRGFPQTRAIAPVVVADDVVGYVSTIERDHPLGHGSLVLVRQASLAVGVEFARQQASIETELKFKGNTLDILLQCAEASPEIRATRSSLLAYDSSALQSLLLLEPDIAPTSRDSPTRASSLHDLVALVGAWARRVSPGSLVTQKDGQIVVLLAGSPPRTRTRPRAPDDPAAAQPRWPAGAEPRLEGVLAELVGALRRDITALVPDTTLSIAVAPQVRDARELHRTYEVARRALSILKLLGENGQVISTTDPRLAVFFLFDSTKPDTRREFVDLVLGPLVAYDQRGRRSLVATLQAYLDHGGNLETTARTLNVHTSTLKYRLLRIAEVSGLDVRNADHRFNAALALRLRTLTGD